VAVGWVMGGGESAGTHLRKEKKENQKTPKTHAESTRKPTPNRASQQKTPKNFQRRERNFHASNRKPQRAKSKEKRESREKKREKNFRKK
jgi:hypothetical protein